MVEQISTENTKKKLLEGRDKERKFRPEASPQSRRAADVVVENAMEKRYLWTARAFAVVFAVSLCCNFILTYAITATMPLYRVEPYIFIFSNKEEQIYRIERPKKIKEYKYLTEMFVREYVILRNTFVTDVDEMELRWGKNSKIFEMSDQNPQRTGNYKEFREKHANQALELIRKYNLERKINIISVNEASNGWWNVEFKATDMMPSYGAPRISSWTAHLRVGYRAKTVRFNERLKNPLGFTVMEYKMEKNDRN